jgi:hypothetical protein
MRVYNTFFYYYIAKTIWRIIYFVLKIEMSVNLNHILSGLGQVIVIWDKKYF